MLPEPARRAFATPLARAIVALAVVVLVGVVFNQNGAFFAWSTHRGMLREISVVGMLACGMTLVIVTGGIDLSVGSVLAAGAVVFSILSIERHASGPVALGGALATGLLFGVASGALVAYVRIPPFIVTLATMVFARGFAKLLSGGRKVAAEGGVLPSLFDSLDARVLGENLAIVTVIFLGCIAVTWLVEAKLRLGRHLFAVGGNAEAARLAGVPVQKVLVFAYGASGLFAGLAGVCQAAQETHGDPETGLGYELDAIAIVVLGGTSLAGGRGSVLLTLVGALTLGYLQKILSLNAFSPEVRLMATGVILVVAVLFQRRRN